VSLHVWTPVQPQLTLPAGSLFENEEQLWRKSHVPSKRSVFEMSWLPRVTSVPELLFVTRCPSAFVA